MILKLNVNKTNTKIVSLNETRCYIYGIGMTDYTIHRNADDIAKTYSDKNYFRNCTILDKHNYHVFRARIRSIVDYIKWRETIQYKGKTYKVVDAYIGIQDRCKAKVDRTFGYPSLYFDGEDINAVPEKIQNVLELAEI